MVLTTKFCPGCQTGKPRTAFYFVKASKGRSERLSGYCKTCHNDRYRARYKKARTSEQRARAHAWALRRKFNISPADYTAMFEAQNGACAICGQPETALSRAGVPRQLVVDHDHSTGRVRALLCYRCNTTLGQLDDRADLARRLADYLEQHARFHAA